MIRRSRLRRRRSEVQCREVGRALQSFLDDDVEEDFAQKIAAHLEACRDCGLEFEVYRRIKTSLAGRMPGIDPGAVERLRAFGSRLTAEEH